MTKKTVDICKAFGANIEEATHKLVQKFKGVCIVRPEFADCEKEYDSGEFEKDGKTRAWAKFTYEVEVDDKPLVNHPEVKQAKPKNRKKAKVA